MGALTGRQQSTDCRMQVKRVVTSSERVRANQARTYCHTSGKLGSTISGKTSWASCSNLTTLLVNDSLKIQMAVSQIHCYFLLKKCKNPLQCNKK